MSELIYKSFLFTREELMVAGALSGMKKLACLLEDSGRELSGEELNRVVFTLYQKGFLLYKRGKEWKLDPEIEILFAGIRDARRELDIYSPGMGGPLLCFQKEDLVVMEVSGNDKSAVLIHFCPAAAFPQELNDRGLVPIRDSLEAEPEEGRFDDLLESVSSLLRPDASPEEIMRTRLLCQEEVTAGILARDPHSREVESALVLADAGIADWIFLARPDGVRMETYTLEALKGFLC